MYVRSFDDEMPRVQVFSCVCPHCGAERLAVDNGRAVLARFTRSATKDTTQIRCADCGHLFERKQGMRQINSFVFEPVGMAV